jgi:hypothetical protein
MQETKLNNKITKAIKKDGMFICGKCGHKIAGYRDGKLYLLCKHKSAGKTCKTINEIDLQAMKDGIKTMLQ